jgi:hypothetical protein
LCSWTNVSAKIQNCESIWLESILILGFNISNGRRLRGSFAKWSFHLSDVHLGHKLISRLLHEWKQMILNATKWHKRDHLEKKRNDHAFRCLFPRNSRLIKSMTG